MPGMAAKENGAEVRSVLGYRFYRLRRPLGRRLAWLFPGLFAFGVALGFALESDLGVGPWTVFHQGVADHTGLTVGTVTALTGIALVVLARPLGEPIGLGTLANALVVGPAIDFTLWVVPDVESLPVRLALLAAAPPLLGVASGLYIGAGLGPGPRDSLMTSAGRRGWSVRLARTVIEVTALTVGWLLGGPVGIGTIVLALTVGYFVQIFLGRLSLDGSTRPA